MNFVAFNPLKSILLSSALLLLAACSSNLTPSSSQTETASHVVTLELKAGDTQAAILNRYGGEILVWTDDYAVLSQSPDVSLSSAAFDDGTVEDNKASFSNFGDVGMNGSSAWASGSSAWASGSSAWASGSSAWASGSSAWASGQFAMMPENTDAWLQVGLDKAYQLAPHLGYGVKVAIIDTGVDLNHPALIEALAPQSEWLDLVDGDGIPQEEGVLGEGAYGHGTLVAGIVRQIAPAATILPIRVLDKDGSGYLSDVVKAVDWAREQGADVVNLSLGSDSYSFSLDITMFFAAKNNVTMIASAGNSGTNQVVFPASNSSSEFSGYNRLSVTSVDSNDLKSDFASFGSNVELAAPGEFIFGPAPDLRMASWSGSSMAAPIASGALALALGEPLTVDSKQLLENLQRQATDISSLEGNEAYNNQLGSGRLDIASFLETVVNNASKQALTNAY